MQWDRVFWGVQGHQRLLQICSSKLIVPRRQSQRDIQHQYDTLLYRIAECIAVYGSINLALSILHTNVFFDLLTNAAIFCHYFFTTFSAMLPLYYINIIYIKCFLLGAFRLVSGSVKHDVIFKMLGKFSVTLRIWFSMSYECWTDLLKNTVKGWANITEIHFTILIKSIHIFGRFPNTHSTEFNLFWMAGKETNSTVI